MFPYTKYLVILALTFLSNVNSENSAETIWHHPKYSFDKRHTGSKWPMGVVKYKFDKSLNPTNIQLIISVFQDIQQKTCVRFEEQTRSKELYVEFKLVDRESDLFQCYLAEPCLPKNITGISDLRKHHPNRKRVLLSKDCTINKSIIVHALGHVLCLGHHFEISDATQTDHLTGLGLMDIELINEVYECKGCHRHRWKDVNILTKLDTVNLYHFGFNGQHKRQIFACRGFVNGMAALGSFTMELGVCQIYLDGRFHNFTVNAKVLTIPNGITTCTEKSNSKIRTLYQYEVVSSFGMSNQNITAMGIPGLESKSIKHFGPGYVAFATLSWDQGDVKVLDKVGTAYSNADGNFKADFKVGDVLVESNAFKLLVCKEIKVKTK